MHLTYQQLNINMQISLLAGISAEKWTWECFSIFVCELHFMECDLLFVALHSIPGLKQFNTEEVKLDIKGNFHEPVRMFEWIQNDENSFVFLLCSWCQRKNNWWELYFRVILTLMHCPQPAVLFLQQQKKEGQGNFTCSSFAPVCYLRDFSLAPV